MNIRNIICFLPSLLVMNMAVWSCSEKQDQVGVISEAAPAVVSVSIENGMEGVDIALGYIDINYDMPVSVADAGAVTLTGTETEARSINTSIRISFGELVPSSEYTLVVGDGAVVSRNGNVPAEPVVLTFTTGEDPDAPPYVPGDPGDYSQSLVTENPLPAASRLYDYMLSIYGRNTLSGAMANVAWNTHEAEWVGENTGSYPAIAFFDYIHLASSPANWIDYGDITPVRDWWNAGGLVGASWHWNVPVSEGSTELTFNAADNAFSAAAAVVDGTWENGVLNADLEKIAGYLKLLQDEGIPVIWRPLHEAAGNTYTYGTGAWFWWGADGAQAFKDLWIHVFDYFREAGLRNLIWVWTTQTSSYADADYAFYPGDEYVDIVGRDIYGNSDASSLASQFNTVTHMTVRKMAALSELGNVADMASQWNAGAQWLYFMPWYDYRKEASDYSGTDHEYADIAWWNAAFASDAVITRDELPAELHQ